MLLLLLRDSHVLTLLLLLLLLSRMSTCTRGSAHAILHRGWKSSAVDRGCTWDGTHAIGHTRSRHSVHVASGRLTLLRLSRRGLKLSWRLRWLLRWL